MCLSLTQRDLAWLSKLLKWRKRGARASRVERATSRVVDIRQSGAQNATILFRPIAKTDKKTYSVEQQYLF